MTKNQIIKKMQAARKVHYRQDDTLVCGEVRRAGIRNSTDKRLVTCPMCKGAKAAKTKPNDALETVPVTAKTVKPIGKKGKKATPTVETPTITAATPTITLPTTRFILTIALTPYEG